MKQIIIATLSLLRKTVEGWSRDNASRLAAATAYFALFSAAPLIVLVVTIAGAVLGRNEVQGRILAQISQVAGHDAADVVAGMIQGVRISQASILASILSLLTLLLTAIGIFLQIKGALNLIWGAPIRPSMGFRRDALDFLRQQLIGFGCVMLAGVLVLASLLLNTVLTALGNTFTNIAGSTIDFAQFINQTLFVALMTAVFAMIYRILPDVRVSWRDVWLGAFVTALLMLLGKILISLYLGLSAIGSAFGAAGTLVVLMAWIYYSSLIFFFGAELTHIYAREYGSLSTQKRKIRMATEPDQNGTPPSQDTRPPPPATPPVTPRDSAETRRALHDINNKLMLIMGHSQLLMRRLRDSADTDTQISLSEIEQGAREIRKLVEVMRQQPPTTT